MTFCSNCGAEFQDGVKFCSSCGQKLGASPSIVPEASSQEEESVIWKGKPQGLKGRALEKAKANATTYVLTSHRLILKKGLVGKKEDQIDLVRIKDIRVKQGIKERALGIGRIEIISTDSSSPNMVLEGIKNPKEVKDLLWGALRKEKLGRGVAYIE